MHNWKRCCPTFSEEVGGLHSCNIYVAFTIFIKELNFKNCTAHDLFKNKISG